MSPKGWTIANIMQARGCIVNEESFAPIPRLQSLTEASKPHAILVSRISMLPMESLQTMLIFYRILGNR